MTGRKPKPTAVKRAQGKPGKLGDPNGAAALRRAGKGGAALQATVRKNADAFAAELAPVVAEIQKAGHT
ncbi:hypothetical protein DRV85_08840 [Rhodosalinus halophilus]|uniref:Uncharacterized protein n=1 Tax=Rhodosalinus halophilus TaxID=2259333 RepID=A0A365UAD0_9RHOB|nr:hypothetical protein [Rhodosalinus halophilus]RBI85816.1 hypothetical protein DRV85_08840 [Rhodosalinus halophilus]